MKTKSIDLRRLKDGERIKDNGFYVISNEWYHDDCANAPSVSSSSLIDIDTDPRKFFHNSIYNPDAEPRPWKPYFNFGHAAHEMILEGDLNLDDYAVRPAMYKSWKSKDVQFWMAEQLKLGKKILTIEDLENLEGMVEAMKSHPVASEVFKSGLVEASMFVKYRDVFVKARPDIIPLKNAGVIQDYKTTTSINPTSLKYEIKKHGYDIKLANVYWCMKQLVPGLPDPMDLSFSLIFQMKTAPYSVYIYPVNSALIKLRMYQNIAALETFSKGMLTGEWPHAYINYEDEYSLSEWDLKPIQDKIRVGEYPALDPDTFLPGEPE